MAGRRRLRSGAGRQPRAAGSGRRQQLPLPHAGAERSERCLRNLATARAPAVDTCSSPAWISTFGPRSRSSSAGSRSRSCGPRSTTATRSCGPTGRGGGGASSRLTDAGPIGRRATAPSSRPGVDAQAPDPSETAESGRQRAQRSSAPSRVSRSPLAARAADQRPGVGEVRHGRTHAPDGYEATSATAELPERLRPGPGRSSARTSQPHTPDTVASSDRDREPRADPEASSFAARRRRRRATRPGSCAMYAMPDRGDADERRAAAADSQRRGDADGRRAQRDRGGADRPEVARQSATEIGTPNIIAKHAGGIAAAASAHLAPISTWIQPYADAASGTTSTPVPIATSAITRSIVLADILLGRDEPRHAGKRDSPERGEQRDGDLDDPPGDAPEPEHRDPSERGDHDVHALVAQHVQEADGLIAQAEAEQRPRTLLHDGTGATRPSGSSDEEKRTTRPARGRRTRSRAPRRPSPR